VQYHHIDCQYTPTAINDLTFVAFKHSHLFFAQYLSNHN
jgi:hypothetical protein